MVNKYMHSKLILLKIELNYTNRLLITGQCGWGGGGGGGWEAESVSIRKSEGEPDMVTASFWPDTKVR